MIGILNVIGNIFSFFKKNYLFVITAYAVLMTFGAYLLFVKNGKLSDNNDRLFNNQTALTEKVRYYQTESGKNAARVTELTLKKDEFEKMCQEQVETIKDLKLKLKRVESVSTTATNTSITVVTQLRDTVIIRDTLTVANVKHFNWSDSWNYIHGIIDGNNVECTYEGNDTINIVATRVPKKFLFFRWGTKYIQIDAVNSNPSSRILYNRTIKVTK